MTGFCGSNVWLRKYAVPQIVVAYQEQAERNYVDGGWKDWFFIAIPMVWLKIRQRSRIYGGLGSPLGETPA